MAPNTSLIKWNEKLSYEKIPAFLSLKFQIKTWSFPEWFKFKSPTFEDKIIEIPTRDFRSLSVLTFKRVPFFEYYIVIDLPSFFFIDIQNLILFRNKNVSDIELITELYTSDFRKHISASPSPAKIFSIPQKDKCQNLRSPIEYFKNDIFLEYGSNYNKNENDYFKRYHIVPQFKTYIGYLGKSELELAKGKEIECRIIFPDNLGSYSEYIFIKNIHSISINRPNGAIHEYYILPTDAPIQILLECKKFFDKYNGYSSISLCGNFFNEEIKNISKDSNFEKNILKYSKVEVTSKREISIEWKQKKKYEPLIYSKANFENYVAGYNSDSRDFIGDKSHDERDLDDLRSDFYSGML